MTIELIIADSHNIILYGLEACLALDPEFKLIGKATTCQGALELARLQQPDILLLDLLMPDLDGLEILATLKSELPQLKIIVLTSSLDDLAVARALRSGARGYLLKNIDVPELCRAIKAVASGQIIISPEVAQLMASRVSITNSLTIENLTERERLVLRLLAQGKANKEIAHQLKLSEGTIKTHISVILAKLGMQSRTQAALFASSLGLHKLGTNNSLSLT